MAAGFRACKRCRPDAVPGTRDWDVRGDLAARAVRRIRDGAIDTVGVSGLADELAVSERHLRRLLVEEVGASPLQLARTRRAHAARALIEQTDLSLTDIAFAAGFGSVRQFGETMREEFGIAPSAIRRTIQRAAPLPGSAPDRGTHAGARRMGANAEPGLGSGSGAPQRSGVADGRDPASDERPSLALRLRTRAPFDGPATRAFLEAHAIPGRDLVEPTGETVHAIDVPGGIAVVRIAWPEVPAVPAQAGDRMVGVPVVLTLPELADAMPAIQAVRRMLDLDADPAQILDALGAAPILAPLLAARPGLRLPAARDAHEFALATVLGQQVSIAAARTLQGRLAFAYASTVSGGSGEAPGFVARVDVARVAAQPVEALRAELRITRARAETIQRLAAALAGGLDLSAGADREHSRAELGAIKGIGPWTVELVAMRALGDPDAYPAGDLILRRALGVERPHDAELLAEQWRPFRGYATQHLWADFLAEAARKDTK